MFQWGRCLGCHVSFAYSEEDTREVLLVSVPSLIIGIPVPLSFVINIIRVGSLCHMPQNSISTFTLYKVCATVASVASVSVWFRSKERPRNGIFCLAVRKIRNHTAGEWYNIHCVGSLATGFHQYIHCVQSLWYWVSSVLSPCTKAVLL